VRSSSSTRRAVSGVVSYSNVSDGVTRRPSARPAAVRRNGVARSSALCDRLLLGRVVEQAEKDARLPEVGRHTDVGHGHGREARILRFGLEERRQLRPQQVLDPRSSMVGHRPRSVVQELDLLLAELGEVQIVDERERPRAGSGRRAADPGPTWLTPRIERCQRS
jgi:hypothetical protein